MKSPVTGIAQGYAVIQIKPLLWMIGEIVNVMRPKLAAALAAFLAKIVITRKYTASPLDVCPLSHCGASLSGNAALPMPVVLTRRVIRHLLDSLGAQAATTFRFAVFDIPIRHLSSIPALTSAYGIATLFGRLKHGQPVILGSHFESLPGFYFHGARLAHRMARLANGKIKRASDSAAHRALNLNLYTGSRA
jgi:hypothetical protein